MIKVGDKVIAKCKDKTKLAFHPGNGVECIVAKVTKHAVLVKYDGGTAWLRYPEIKRCIEPKFKIGERVTPVGDNHVHTGHTGTIVDIYDSDWYHERVYVIKIEYGTFGCKESILIPEFTNEALGNYFGEF